VLLLLLLLVFMPDQVLAPPLCVNCWALLLHHASGMQAL
jgi:hypothetical protein